MSRYQEPNDSRYSQSSFPSSCPVGCKVYVGGLTREASRDEIERAFSHYGKIRNLFVARNPPGFAFIEYDSPDDAEDSVRALDGRFLCGVRVRVEISNGKSRHKGPIKRTYNPDNGFRRHRSRSFERFDRRRGSHSRSSSRSRGGRENGAARGEPPVPREPRGGDVRGGEKPVRSSERHERHAERDREPREHRRKPVDHRSRSRS